MGMTTERLGTPPRISSRVGRASWFAAQAGREADCGPGGPPYFPTPRGAYDVGQLGIPWTPAQHAPRGGRIGHQSWYIAGPARSVFRGHRAACFALHGLNHFTHGVTLPRAE